MPTTIGELTNVPAPGDPIRSQIIQDLSSRVVQRFASLAALQAQWASAPNGARALPLDTFRPYTKRAAGGAGWQPDYDGAFATFTADAGGNVVIAHALGRIPDRVNVNVGQNLNVTLPIIGRTTTT